MLCLLEEILITLLSLFSRIGSHHDTLVTFISFISKSHSRLQASLVPRRRPKVDLLVLTRVLANEVRLEYTDASTTE